MATQVEVERKPRLVVGVGASAGGLEAFRKLLSALPEHSGMCFLLVQHLAPHHESMLTGLLTRSSKMRVVEAEHDAALHEDTVYVIRPDTTLEVDGGRLAVSKAVLKPGMRLTVDSLFRSLAQQHGSRSVGIVLSGAGHDGSAGLRDIKAAGGLVLVQEPSSAGQEGMPRSAMETGAVDLVLPIDEMPAALARFAQLSETIRLEPTAPAATPLPDEPEPERPLGLSEAQLDRLARILDGQAHIDVRAYKSGTIERRVLRRMALVDEEAVDGYLERVGEDGTERQALIGDLLISVTEFFRDPEAFDALREEVIEPLVAQLPAHDTVRCWVAGCATGEEAYSIAMEILDASARHEKKLDLQIFATDIDEEALSLARAGAYPMAIEQSVSVARLREYFTRIDGKGYQACSRLRDAISFAAHDLTRDPPFSRMHLVSCRNLLIYLKPEAQRHALSALHFALKPGGHLFLGTSESTRPQPTLFSTLSKTWRVCRKLGTSRPLSLVRGPSRVRREPAEAPHPRAEPSPPLGRRRLVGAADPAQSALLKARVPPSIVVSDEGNILFMHGELRPYLRFPEGSEPRLELSSLVAPELVTRTRAALYKCRRDGESVVAISSPEQGQQRTRITATPAPGLSEGAVVLSFEDVEGPARESEPEALGPEQDAVIAQLESELQATQEDLRTTVEELESSNEELRSSNEEASSMNEELQSANEELEATTEELRSLNEELTTVNTQLREKVEEVERGHDDLANFFASAKIATLFLDEELRIKRFTPSATELLGLDDGALGRRVGDFARELLQNRLSEEAQAVLDDLVSHTRELKTSGGRWIRREVLPYRTESRRIEGVVVTMVDVTDLKNATARVAAREREQAVVARLGLLALEEMDLQHFMDRAVNEVQRTLGTDYCKILELQPDGRNLMLRAGVGWRDELVGTAQVPATPESQAGYTLRSNEPVIVDDLATELRFSGPALLHEHDVVSGLSCVIREDEGVYGVLGAHSREHREFTREDANFAQAVATVVGSAINRHQTRLRLAIEGGVARVLADSHGLDDAAMRVLECLGRELDASVGELWWLEGDGDGLECRQSWTRRGDDKDVVDSHFSRGRFEPGEGLVGLVFHERRAAWITDLADRSEFARIDAAHELGLAAGMAFPVVAGNTVWGVVTIFSRRSLIADGSFLRSLEALGRSIGEYYVHEKAEEKVRDLAAVVECSDDAIITHDFDGIVTGWWGGASSLYGYDEAEMVGASIDRLVPEANRGEHRQLAARVERGERIAPLESTRVGKHGQWLDVSVRVSPIKDDAGRIVAVASTERDIRKQKDVERRLVEADRQKDEFLAMLSHELRNPLAAIRNATEVLKSSEGERDQAEHAQAIIERQSAHMAKLLDGLLDVSRIIRGKITLDTERVDFTEICRNVAADVGSRVAGRALDFQVELPEYPVWLEADPTRLTQVVDNLLSNALRYTEDGGRIVLRLRTNDETACLEVSDTGIGIAPELMPHIFEVFRQARQSLARSSGGLGLGLPLVKSLVELHGGSVEAHSEGRGKGATFVVHLATTRTTPEPRPPVVGDERHWRILVVEDNEDAAQMLRTLLEMAGHRVDVATHGQEAVGAAQQLRPEVVLCDLGLPDGFTGFDVARALRRDPELKDVCLVAISGYGRPEDRERSSSAGFDAHVTKPVDVGALRRVLGGLEGRLDGKAE